MSACELARRELDGTDAAAVEALTDLLRPAGERLFFTGQGRSGLVAQMAAMRFMHPGRQVHVVGESTAPSLRTGDVLVVVSGSGRTATSVAFARIAVAEGGHVLLVTHEVDSPLRTLAEVSVLPVAGTVQSGGGAVRAVRAGPARRRRAGPDGGPAGRGLDRAAPAHEPAAGPTLGSGACPSTPVPCPTTCSPSSPTGTSRR